MSTGPLPAEADTTADAHLTRKPACLVVRAPNAAHLAAHEAAKHAAKNWLAPELHAPSPLEDAEEARRLAHERAANEFARAERLQERISRMAPELKAIANDLEYERAARENLLTKLEHMEQRAVAAERGFARLAEENDALRELAQANDERAQAHKERADAVELEIASVKGKAA